ncbi:MAG: hypothetical protein WCK35_02825 [Chloroflexota bacterium]
MSNLNVDPETTKSAISVKLVEALITFYEPANTFQESDDSKTTAELLNEMGDMEEIYPYEVNRLMEERGFKIHYDGSGYVWLLKKK